MHNRLTGHQIKRSFCDFTVSACMTGHLFGHIRNAGRSIEEWIAGEWCVLCAENHGRVDIDGPPRCQIRGGKEDFCLSRTCLRKHHRMQLCWLVFWRLNRFGPNSLLRFDDHLSKLVLCSFDLRRLHWVRPLVGGGYTNNKRPHAQHNIPIISNGESLELHLMAIRSVVSLPLHAADLVCHGCSARHSGESPSLFRSAFVLEASLIFCMPARGMHTNIIMRLVTSIRPSVHPPAP